MLPANQRLTSPAEYREVVRRGRRCGGPVLVAHLLTPGPTHPATCADPSGEGAGRRRVGLVVSKAVGQAVTRNRVKRRLRHLARERVDQLPDGALLVLRALPAAAQAPYDDLAAELDRCLRTCLSAPGRRPPRDQDRETSREQARAGA